MGSGQRAMPQAKNLWQTSSVTGGGQGVKNGQAQHLQFLGFWVLGCRHLIELDTVNAKTRPLFVAAAAPHAGRAVPWRQRARQGVLMLGRAAMNIGKPFLPSTLFPEGAGGLRTAGADSAGRPGAAPPGAAAQPAAQAFSAVLEQSQPTAPRRPSAAAQVKSGDTLLGIVREQAAQRGLGLSGSQSMRLVQQLARDSGIANANRIAPGQPLALAGLHSRLSALASGDKTDTLNKGGARAALSSGLANGVGASAASVSPSLSAARALGPAAGVAPVSAARTAAQRLGAAAYGVLPASPPQPAGLTAAAALTAPDLTQVPVVTSTASASTAAALPAVTPPNATGKALAGPHPVLEQTLDRAVARGFIPAIERGDVYDKIVELSARYRFKPDDFARLTLIESDGMNPRASNERCHGIIQFCDGNDRGAATAGFAANPRAILGFSVYQQLHLVDRYFSEVGIKPGGTGQAGLDELYLAVLMPAARNTTDPQAPLGIPGTQASVLHPGRDRSVPITRQSILDGLQQHASDRLSGYGPRSRPQVASNEAAGRLR